MNDFQSITRVLADRPSPLKVFFRDDDAGWADARMQQLIDEFVFWDLPLDIAVIPEAVTDTTVEVINRAFELSDKINIHQHGFTHTNHQLSGRSSEFGTDRNHHQQQQDIVAGQRKLADVFGTKITPFFTPPWNRCTSDTAAVLKSIDIQFLSRIVGSDPLDSDLLELPVSIDWLKKRKGVYLSTAELVEYMCDRLRPDVPVIGVMLHHEHMDQANRKLLQHFIACLRQSKNVSFHSMEEAASFSISGRCADQGVESGNDVERRI